MKKYTVYILAITLTFLMNACMEEQKFNYPQTKKVDTVDVYFGHEVADPYRWLEDDNSEETAEWVKAQNEITFDYIKNIPFRDKIEERLTQIWNYPKYSVPFKKGKYVFFFKNDGMQNQDVLYIQEGLEGDPKVLLDPNTFSDDGTVALSMYSISRDGKYLAYGTSTGGSDWNELYVMEIESGEKLVDHLEWVKFSGIGWKGHGFYYSRYDEPAEGEELSQANEYHKLYFHEIGTTQDQDKLIYDDPTKPMRNYVAYTQEDEKHLFLMMWEASNGNALYFMDFDNKSKGFQPIVETYDKENLIVDVVDDHFLMMTNNNAPKKRLVRINPSSPGEANWVNVIPEQEEVLQNASVAGGMIVAEYMKDAYSKAYVYDYNGNFKHEMELPGIGTMFGLAGRKNDNTAFYGYTSFTFPSSIYKYNVAENSSELYRQSEIDFDPSLFETKQVFFESKDGTKVPMFIVHKKGLELDGNNPTLLYAYGGFNISITPTFSISRLIFLENNGVYAVANLRGGGEYGEEWHMAGTKLQKQNVFDDFIAAAEYLIEEDYTCSDKLAVMGGSNGGLLVGAVMTQRPDLFEVALPLVGVMDMLRYHKFTIGWAWAGDYGTSEESEEMFKYLYGYSPLHNIKDGVEYPSTLVMTADHDDRVVPAHSFKFMAELQAKHNGDDPVIIRIETMAGHGAGKPTSKIIEEAADLSAFTLYNLDAKVIY